MSRRSPTRNYTVRLPDLARAQFEALATLDDTTVTAVMCRLADRECRRRKVDLPGAVPRRRGKQTVQQNGA